MSTYKSEDRSAGKGTVTVRQTRSAIGNKPKNRGTLRALGLRKIGDEIGRAHV